MQIADRTMADAIADLEEAMVDSLLVQLDALGYTTDTDDDTGVRLVTRRADNLDFFLEGGRDFSSDPMDGPKEYLTGEALALVHRIIKAGPPPRSAAFV